MAASTDHLFGWQFAPCLPSDRLSLFRDQYELGRHCERSRNRFFLRGNTPSAVSLQVHLPVLHCLHWHDRCGSAIRAMAMENYRLRRHLSPDDSNSQPLLPTSGTQPRTYAIHLVDATERFEHIWPSWIPYLLNF